MNRNIIGFIVLFCIFSSPGFSQTTVFDFDSGFGSDWTVNNDSGLFEISNSSQDVRISKDADDLSVMPNAFIFGTISSEFCVTGDFTATVDFEILNMPALASNPLNECVLGITGHNSSEGFLVLRFTNTTQQWLEAFSSSAGQIGQHANPLNSGRFRISQTGTTISGFYAESGSSTFTALGSTTTLVEPKRISLQAVQGYKVVGNRGSTALDMRFDNLVIEGEIIYNCDSVATELTTWSTVKALYR